MSQSPTYLNVFTVQEYERDGKTQHSWNKIGVAFPHGDDKEGFNIQLNALPLDGKCVALPPDPASETQEPEGRAAERGHGERSTRSSPRERRR